MIKRVIACTTKQLENFKEKTANLLQKQCSKMDDLLEEIMLKSVRFLL